MSEVHNKVTEPICHSRTALAAKPASKSRHKWRFREIGLMPAVFLFIAALICLSTQNGFAQNFLKTLDDPIPQAGASFGFRVVKLQDVDQDGIPDFAVSASDQGKVFIVSGANGSVLHTLEDPNPQADALFGAALADVGDVDGDGTSDLAVGAFEQDVGGNRHQGQVLIFSGATGALSRVLDDPAPQGFAAFGFPVVAISDAEATACPISPLERLART